MFQHPIPQNIATYQFHLIGSMTLKQFMIAIAGVGLAVLAYTSNLIFIIKAPLIIVCFFGGIATALLPYDDRSLDQWLSAFLKAIYSPTQFLWQKNPTLPAYFNYSTQKHSLTAAESQAMFNAAINKKRAGLSSYLQTISENSSANSLEKAEASKMQQYLTYFTTPARISNSVTQPPIPAAKLTTSLISPTAPSPSPSPAPSKPTTASPVITAPIISPVVIPKSPIRPTPIPIPVASQAPATPQPQPQKAALYPPDRPPAAIAASQSAKLPFPVKPTSPNTVVGMVFDPQGNIIENAIIEIRDQNGNPVRATKTNRLGQFFSTTPLKNGHYELEIDSPPHQFAILKLELTNRILEPLEIRARS